MAELLRTLLAIPIAAAIVAALLGPRRAVAIRWISLGATLACAVLAFILALNLNSDPLLRGSALKTAAAPTFDPSYKTQWAVVPIGPGVIQAQSGPRPIVFCSWDRRSAPPRFSMR